eukprot:84297-Prymnesium_polylepis.1
MVTHGDAVCALLTTSSRLIECAVLLGEKGWSTRPSRARRPGSPLSMMRPLFTAVVHGFWPFYCRRSWRVGLSRVQALPCEALP